MSFMEGSLPPGGITRNIPDKLIELVSNSRMDADVRRAEIRAWLSVLARRIQCHCLASESGNSESFISGWLELIEFSQCVPPVQLKPGRSALKHPDTMIPGDSVSKLNAEYRDRIRCRSRDGRSQQ